VIDKSYVNTLASTEEDHSRKKTNIWRRWFSFLVLQSHKVGKGKSQSDWSWEEKKCRETWWFGL